MEPITGSKISLNEIPHQMGEGVRMTSSKAHGQDKIHFVDAIIQKLASDAEAAKERWVVVPKRLKSAPPECKAVWASVVFCFTFEQYFAALSVCGAFVEAFLERAIPDFCKMTGVGEKKVPADLHDQIRLASSVGLISQEDEEILQDFRKLIRNRFAHGDVVALADSLLSIEVSGEVSEEEGKTKIQLHNEEFLAQLRQETVRERLDHASRAFAPPVIRWIGNWAGRCGKTVWGAEQ
jgi:hypothetical protein